MARGAGGARGAGAGVSATRSLRVGPDSAGADPGPVCYGKGGTVPTTTDADLVLGSRYSNGVRVVNWPLKRLLLSRCAGVYVWLVTGMPFTDPTGGFKCFRRRALQSIQLVGLWPRFETRTPEVKS